MSKLKKGDRVRWTITSAQWLTIRKGERAEVVEVRELTGPATTFKNLDRRGGGLEFFDFEGDVPDHIYELVE